VGVKTGAAFPPPKSSPTRGSQGEVNTPSPLAGGGEVFAGMCVIYPSLSAHQGRGEFLTAMCMTYFPLSARQEGRFR
jgi:hypothetical protein